jgi:hypothetical protein
MRAKKFSFVESLINSRVGDAFCALSDCPFCRGTILGLDCAQPPNNIVWLLKRLQRNMLIQESLMCDIHEDHL